MVPHAWHFGLRVRVNRVWGVARRQRSERKRGKGPQLYLRTVALTVSADDGITCEEDLPLHHKGEELRRARMEHNFQRRAAQRDANLARLGDLRREPRCKHRQEGGSQHAEV